MRGPATLPARIVRAPLPRPSAPDPMTNRLYYSDSYLDRFRSRVEEISPDRSRVYLERTAFYPTSGGQPFDVGRLGEHPVVDVVDEGDRVAHVLGGPAGDALRPGEEVEGRIDWARRFDHMQQHTGQHLLSAVLQERFGWATVGVHFGARSSSLDLDAASVPAERIAEAERAVNEVVFRDWPVTTSFEDAAEAEGLRKASARTGTLRIVTIQGLDRAACGGTHVRATGEIGAILIRGVERVRRSVRLEFVCGGRAVAHARSDFEALSRLARSFSTSLDGVAAVVEAQSEQLRRAAAEGKRILQELARARALALWNAAEADAAGLRWLVPGDDALDADELRALAHAVAGLPRAVLVATRAEPPTVLLAASADSGIHAGEAIREAMAAVGGRGGGSPRVAQGSVPDADAAAAAARMLRGARAP